ncbi:MAG TPA: hypothetical protein VIY49_22560 [Bryobacteraceae bacterium]
MSAWKRIRALDGLLCDLRFALRSLRRDRGFAAAAVVMLALAIGLNQTAFRVMDATLFRGYRMVKDNDRVLYITERLPGAGCCVSYFDFERWRDESHAFQELAFMALRSWPKVTPMPEPCGPPPIPPAFSSSGGSAVSGQGV